MNRVKRIRTLDGVTYEEGGSGELYVEGITKMGEYFRVLCKVAKPESNSYEEYTRVFPEKHLLFWDLA